MSDESVPSDEVAGKRVRVVGEDALFVGCGECRGGWRCEAHPSKPWPHPAPDEPGGECDGPGVPCECNPQRVVNVTGVIAEVGDDA
jgi:hypothetical protein